MEVRPGFQLSDVGVIPEDWEPLQVRDVCRLINGRGFKPFEWKSTGLPIIRIQNLNGSEEFNFYPGHYDPKILVESGQLLFAWSGSRGTSFGPHIWSGERALLNYHTWKVVVNERKVTPDFLLYSLRHLTGYIEDRAHGASALVHTQKWQMEKYPIAVPTSNSEQQAIADALTDVDALLAGLGRLIAKNRDLKQAAMQQLLTGQMRLTGFQDEWEVKRLGELGSTYGGLTAKSKADFGVGKATYVTFMNVMSNTVIDHTIFESVCVSPSENQNRVERGDLLFNSSSETPEEVALCSLVTREDSNLYLNSFCFGFRLHESADADGLFLTYYIRSTKGREIIKSLAQGSTRYNLSKKSLLAAEVKMPTLSEQIAIAVVLSDMDAELTTLEARRDKTRALKQGMMQELLTGRIRLV